DVIFQPDVERDVIFEATQKSHGNVGVAVDETRQDEVAGGIDVFRGSELGLDLSARAHVQDCVTLYGDRAVLEDAALRVHGDHGASGNHQVGLRPFLLRDRWGSEESGTRDENIEAANLFFHRNRSVTLRQKEYQRLEASKGLGKRLRICSTSIWPLRLERMTGTSPQNSQ